MYWKMVIALYLGMLVFTGMGHDTSFAAEPMVIIADGEYVMGTGETMEVAEERAKKAAMRSAAEKAGAFVKSYTKVKNLALESDVIEVIANHSMKVEVIDLKRTGMEDLRAIRFHVKIKAVMAEEEIASNLKKIREDKHIVDAYNRLKVDYEKQNKEVEQLKRQLVNAVGGDKQKIARLISEEEKKFKANLWVEKAQRLSTFDGEALNAYKKALELNPALAQAYVGIAEALRFQNMGETSELKELEKKLKGLREALANLDKAVSVDDNYADAYGMRAGVWEEISATERKVYEQKDILHDFADMEKKYQQRIFEDINRSIALDAPNKADMYRKRAFLSVRAAVSAEDDRSSPEASVGNFDKALADVNQAIALCKAEDPDCLIKSYRAKGDVYSNLRNHYILRNNDAVREKEAGERMGQWYRKANEVAQRQRRQFEEEEVQMKELQQTTEIGKLSHDLEYGWREGILGARKDLEGKSEEEKEKIAAQALGEVKKRISSGTASAEDYLLMAMFAFDDSVEARKNNYARGISLLEKKKPEGRKALLLVHFYTAASNFHFDQQQYDRALNGLNKAQAVIDKYLVQAQESLSVEELRQIEKTGLEAAKKLNKERAEAFYWLQFAVLVPSGRAKIYEKLDLSAKAIEEYRYLCKTLKYKEACGDVERLK